MFGLLVLAAACASHPHDATTTSPPVAIPIVIRVVDYDVCNGNTTEPAHPIKIQLDGHDAASISIPCDAAAGQQHPPTFDSPHLTLSLGTHHIVATDSVTGAHAEHDVILTTPPPASAFDAWFTVEVSASATSLQISDPSSASLKS